MGSYITKRDNIASKKEYSEWSASGHFTGTFENYLAASLPNEVTTDREVTWEQYQNLIKQFPSTPHVVFWNAELGENCTDCAGFGDYLCDYPVGDDKTCDRIMCNDHAKEISNDLHYCEAHYEEWRAFRDGGGVERILSNVIAFKHEK